jgi:RNA recognition motif-containing protein
VSTTLYVSNLPLAATEELLAGKSGKFGAVVSVKLDRDAVIDASRRGSFVELSRPVAGSPSIAR